MKAVFVSDVSPARGHIYGLRVSSFARAMARRGHGVVVLSPTYEPEDVPVAPQDLAALLQSHDWAAPLFVTAPPEMVPHIEASRNENAPAPLRRMLTAYLLAFEGGVHGDWERGARPLARALAAEFRPDAVWAVFGNASTLVVAQKLARAAGASWFMDIKDNWEIYTPAAVRGLMTRRFKDAAGYTSNAYLHADIAARFLPHRRTILYSGVADVMAAPPDAEARSDRFLLTLVGSTYRDEMLAHFLSGLQRWLTTLTSSDRQKVSLRYVGIARSAVDRVLSRANVSCATETSGNIPHAELAQLCQSAAANCYLWAPYGFHHKLLELLSTRRPVISFPGEHDESCRLSREVKGELIVCSDEEKLIAAFDAIWRRWGAGDISANACDISRLNWDAGAEKLEKFLQSALPRSGRSRQSEAVEGLLDPLSES
ncbi:glycosyltransferase family 4 protein [Methylocystis sp. SC2]|uniref:glycosyltransferase family 4 protein n=1 Tax=Methylocystis sp. (strain SC2) TaxID=187303 RepID=UPI00031F4FD2|nr:glycosyltransferase family 4 protein [Methylocystis sp. SC2]